MKRVLLSACLAALAVSACAHELSMRGVRIGDSASTEVESRAFADGIAKRYRLSDARGRVSGEDTFWTLPTDAVAWYQPAVHWQGQAILSYEAPYTNSTVAGIPVGTLMTLPVVVKRTDGTYRLITEANVKGWTDSAVVYRGNGVFAIDYWCEHEGFVPGEDVSPWRVTLVASNLQTLATSDIVRRLCPAPAADVAAKCAAFVKPGRCVWQWLPAGDPVYEEQKDWYDRTKALGFEYYLVDDGWKRWRDGEMDQWACLKKWIDYGKSIGVETFMWVDSKEMPDAQSRRTYLEKVKATGAVGIKIDFIPMPTRAVMDWYEETLADTLELGLMTDFHGCVKPSGRERCWPHEVAREAIRGHEWHITRYNRALPFEHDCVLPFLRLVQGHADYTPMVFEPKQLIHFTWAHQLAQGIVFSAPFLCFGDFPKNYQENPAAAFIRGLPSVYDEVRILPGSEIGESVVVAKRKGETWYLAIENGSESRHISIDLSFLKETCRIEAFGDASSRLDDYRRTSCIVRPSDTLEIDLQDGGGYAARLEAVGIDNRHGNAPEAGGAAKAACPWVMDEEREQVRNRVCGYEFQPGTPEADASRLYTNTRRTEYVAINYDESKSGEGEYALEDPLTFADGSRVRSAADWERRRWEILDLFEREVYGRLPPKPAEMTFDLVAERLSDDRFATYRRYRQYFRLDRTGPVIDWFVAVPRYARGKSPVFLHLNYAGLDQIEAKKTNHYDLPLDMLITHGYAFMSARYTQITADPRDGESGANVFDGVCELWGRRDPKRTDNPGALMVWAWGLMRGLDLAERLPEIDATRNVVIGSSRLGKAALLAAAYDSRFKVCIPNQTGAVGVQLMKRDYGESLKSQHLALSHWYCQAIWKYEDNPKAQPFDQHLLLACVAPRALLLECYHKKWFDPKGEWLAAKAASSVWMFLTGRGLDADEWPEPYSDVLVRPPFGYVRRTECHGLSSYDWKWAVHFANRAFAAF